MTESYVLHPGTEDANFCLVFCPKFWADYEYVMTCHRLPSVLGGSLKSVRFLLTQEGHLMYLGGLGSYTFGGPAIFSWHDEKILAIRTCHDRSLCMVRPSDGGIIRIWCCPWLPPQAVTLFCPCLWALSLPLIYICCQKLMKSVGTDGSLSLPFVRKVMVGYFVNDTYKVTAALLFVVSLLVRWNWHHSYFKVSLWNFLYNLIDMSDYWTNTAVDNKSDNSGWVFTSNSDRK